MTDYSNVSIDKALAKRLDEIVAKEPRYKSRSWLIHHICNNWVDDWNKQRWA